VDRPLSFAGDHAQFVPLFRAHWVLQSASIHFHLGALLWGENEPMSEDEGPKSAIELAMEKLRASGDYEETTLSQEQKTKIADVRSLCTSKIAELEIQQEAKMQQATSLEDLNALKEELSREKARLSEEMERKVQTIRAGE